MSASAPVVSKGRLVRRLVMILAGSVVSMSLGLVALTDALDLFGSDREATGLDSDVAAHADGGQSPDPASGRDQSQSDSPGREELDEDQTTTSIDGQDVYHRRDPFSPVVASDAAVTNAGAGTVSAPTPSGPSSPTTSGAIAPPSDPSLPAPTDTSGDPAEPSTPGCAEAEGGLVCDGDVVSVAHVGTDPVGELQAVVQIGSRMYEATAGVSLPGGMEITGISRDCVDLRYDGQSFRVCETSTGLK